MMVLAIVVAHVVSVVIKRRPEEERTYTPHLVGTLVVLGLIAVGIMTIGRPLVGS
jgi:heme A synthase